MLPYLPAVCVCLVFCWLPGPDTAPPPPCALPSLQPPAFPSLPKPATAAASSAARAPATASASAPAHLPPLPATLLRLSVVPLLPTLPSMPAKSATCTAIPPTMPLPARTTVPLLPPASSTAAALLRPRINNLLAQPSSPLLRLLAS